MRARRQLLLSAVAAAALAGGATAALSLAQDPGTTPAAGAPSTTAGADRYAALARPQRDGDTLPPGVLARFGPDNPTGPDVAPDTARKVATIAGDELFVAEGAASFCAIDVGADGWAGGCTAKARVESGEPQVTFDLVSSAAGNAHRVWGVAPDDVRSAALVMDDATRIPIVLHDGAFELTTAAAGTAFAWTDAQGVEHSVAVTEPPAG